MVPAVDASRPAYVRAQVEFGIHFARPQRDRTVRARARGLDAPGEGSWRQVPTAPTTTLPITSPGPHRFWVHLVVDGTELELHHDFEALTPSRRTDDPDNLMMVLYHASWR